MVVTRATAARCAIVVSRVARHSDGNVLDVWGGKLVLVRQLLYLRVEGES